MTATNTPPRIAHGGKAVYGARLGILMLEARFPRIPGDMGNAVTWPFPVLYKVVRGAPERVPAAPRPPRGVRRRRPRASRGRAGNLVTNCGFLSLFRRTRGRMRGAAPRR
jgi:hypothetical protein